MRARTILITALGVGAVGAGLVIGMRSGSPVTGVQAACPRFTPMHGLMPLLFRIGVLPKPPIAASVAPSDTSTSIVIQPDRHDQIQCGKTPLKSIENVVYAAPKLPNGKSMSLKMDLLIPEPVRKRTVVVYVPGGGFVVAAKEGALNLRTYVAEAGFAVVSVQYRTTRDGANYRDGVEDIKAAIRYLRANAGQYGIDATAVALWGESAGGYLAAMVGVTNHNSTFEAGANLNQSSDVQGVIDDFGASDISKIAADFDAATQHVIYTNEGLVQYIGKTPDANTLDSGIATTAANPLKYIQANAPPFIIFHGNQDRMVSPSQTAILHDALVATGVRSTRYVVDGAAHGDLSFMGDTQSGLLWSTNRVMNLIVDFLNRLNAAT
ncbi:MAG TPA: alpha/beta hydrolase [Steroidobacteraceae bacterium]|nr:alpha/beta hydrolase [Steroidobacteraceae bacterium]